MNNVKILCIAGSIVLGSILLSGQAFGKAPSDLITLSAPKEPEGQYVSYDIDGSGSYYDSDSDITYYFVKGIVTSYSNSFNLVRRSDLELDFLMGVAYVSSFVSK